MACIWVVTWASTQLCVGICVALADAIDEVQQSRDGVRRCRTTGLMPMTASPEPSSRPSRMAAAMPAGSSVGWLGCRRVERRPGRPTVVRKRVTTRILRGDGDEVLHAHELGDGGGHLGREAGRERGQPLAGGIVGEQPVAELADGESCDGREGGGVVGVEDEAGDFVRLVGDDRFGEEGFSGRSARAIWAAMRSRGGCGADAGEFVAGARRCRPGENCASESNLITNAADRVRIHHCA